MKAIILERLKKFEKDNNVEVILAVESGSRGWGFASEDSDYDVRFVYKHPADRYLDLHPPSMSHDWIEGNADYEGFDIHKFYDLLYKSNMNIIDWLMQDVIKEKGALKQNVSAYFDRRTYVAHNLGLCNKNYHKYFISGVVNEPTAKRYVYCIRALLSALYCDTLHELAPLKFQDLISDMLRPAQREEIEAMLEVKKKSKEKECYNNRKWLKWIEGNLKMVILSESSKVGGLYYNVLNNHMKLQFRGV